jgi:PAS domain S-box-containing protein
VPAYGAPIQGALMPPVHAPRVGADDTLLRYLEEAAMTSTSPPSSPTGTRPEFANQERNRSEAHRAGTAASSDVIGEQLRLLVHNVKDYAIFVLDPDGRVASWNEGAERIKGYTAAEILGQSFERFYPPEPIARRFPQYELEMAARDGRFEDEGWRVRKDGSLFWASVVITALRNAQGELIGFGKVTRDLTERRRLEEQARRLAAEEAARLEAQKRSAELEHLNQRLLEQKAELDRALSSAEAARDDAQEAYRALDQFAYVASHDLKAPLRGIMNLAEWLKEDLGAQLNAESAKHLNLLQGRVQRMAALIDGILAYSRAGRKLQEPESVDSGALVREVIEMLSPPEGVRIDIQPGMPTVWAERIPFQQVMLNLISNAVKYASAVRPDVEVRVQWRDKGDQLEFSVSDNGPGIAPEYHERIWGLFQTLAARDKVEGTGIGLSVVRKVVETRGGQAWIESAPGKGATLRFTWRKSPQEKESP